MSYTIYYSDPAKRQYPLVVQDHVVLNGIGTGNLNLVGRTYAGYGQAIAENFIRLLENSASPVPPINPIEGQLWYDSYNKKLRINYGSSNTVSWKPINGLYQQATQPTDAVNGDLWVNTTSNQLYVSNGSVFRLIGPKDPTDAISGMYVEQVMDTLNVNHDVASVYIADTTTSETNRYAIFSKDSFAYPDYFNFPNGIKAGINLKDGTILNGIADSANYLWQGTNKIPGASYVRNDIDQSINGQLSITQDSNALKIGAEPTFILERTLNGTNANITNSYQGFGTFSFNIKDNNFVNIKVMTIGGDNKQVKVITTTTSFSPTTGAMVVSGGLGVGENLNVAGNVNINGKTIFSGDVVFVNTATQLVTNQAFAGNIYTIHSPDSGTDWQYADGKDVGLQFKYYNSSLGGGSSAGVVMSITDRSLNWYETGYTTPTQFIGTKYGTMNAGTINLKDTTTSTNTLSGAMVVVGGVGVGGNMNVGGDVTVGGAVNLTNLKVGNSNGTAGQVLVTDGTSTVYWGSINNASTFTGGIVVNPITIQSTSTSALSVSGGANIAGNLSAGYVTANNGAFAALTVTSLNVGTINGAIYTTTNFSGNIATFNTLTTTVLNVSTMTANTASINLLYSNTINATAGLFSSLYAENLSAANITVSSTGTFAVNGTAQFSGTATYINSTDTFIRDNIIELHTPPLGAWATSDNKDVGLRLRYYNTLTSSDASGGLILANDTKFLEWYNLGYESSGTFVGTSYGTFKTGNVVIASGVDSTSTQTGAVTVTGGIGTTGNLNVGGQIVANGNITAFSDIRLKTDLEQIRNAVDKVKLLTGYTYTRTDTHERQTGLVAQDVFNVLPEAVNTSSEYMSVAYGNLVGLLVEAIKSIDDRLSVLERKL